ncbi:MAG: 3,4-dihydroxy-2-butanone-4-phosphate synthase [Nitrospiraceae bacterium]|nr:3,4-dihydroxy-2-butanone-4-phosphate synthase [Nitrospiraceae bacterium]
MLDREIFSPISEAIEHFRRGETVIIVDDEDRENEGDLVIAAEKVTPEAINFMAKYARGLICLALTPQRVEELHLPQQAVENTATFGTAFTVSIDARKDITTGISAADRATTIHVAIDPKSTPSHLARPGHIFPLKAQHGGVLKRAGQTEGSVDLARLAGLTPAGVICEIMKDDGTMARMDDLVAFARLHKLKMGTIRDLIAYRRQHDHLVEKRAEMTFTSRWGGDWKAITFFNKATGDETMALVKGHIDPAQPTLVRMHTMSMFVDVFGETNERAGLLSKSMEMIADESRGVLVLINKPMKGIVSRFMQLRAAGKSAGDPQVEELRDYGVGAQILAELGVQDMILLSNTHHSLVGLEGYGLSIVGERAIPGTGGE